MRRDWRILLARGIVEGPAEREASQRYLDLGGVMKRGRLMLGLITGVLLLVSSAAHSLLGWPQFRHGLTEAHAPADLIVGLSLGWQFAGLAMLVFGVI
ncbi:MAG TPA: hypothetical protein VFN40_04985, partial [Gemmatimonadales bacterium]|nr:hypothetical protein [Gemmatimonadales bacterium]